MADAENLIKERQKTHGNYATTASITELIRSMVLDGMHSMNEPLDSVIGNAVGNIAQKLARISSGNPKEPDHWRDIAGYATLVVNYLNERHNDG